MASGWTNRGRYLAVGKLFRDESDGVTTEFKAPLFADTTTPDVDDNIVSDLTQIATGNGYVDGGPGVADTSAGFDVWTEDDTNDRGFVQAADIVYTASGGPIPSSGTGARWMAITDDNATVNSRQIFVWADLVSLRNVSDGQALTIQDFEIRINLA